MEPAYFCVIIKMKKMELKNNTILITGGTSGFGLDRNRQGPR